uniref:Uncharacterized protein n=1 Tax=Ditylenchus dipsaci TaxID=166011 RepID=A0A915CTG2_9BILA
MTVKKLRQLENTVTEKICQNLIEVVELQKDSINSLGNKAERTVLEDARKRAIGVFQESVRSRMETIYGEENMEEKFSKLEEDSKMMKGKKGWRPSGDPQKDTYASRRPLLVNEIERLEKLRSELSDQVEAKREAALELKQKVDTCIAEFGL